jgi:hypothetical protein
MAILSTAYYDNDKVQSTVRLLADQANSSGFVGQTGPTGPQGPQRAGVVGPVGPTGPSSPNTRFIPPLTDPKVAGAVWNNCGTLQISQGY